MPKRVIVFTAYRDKAEEKLKELTPTDNILYFRIGGSGLSVYTLDGGIFSWVNPFEPARGHKATKIYVDKEIPKEIVEGVILPCLTTNDINWF